MWFANSGGQGAQSDAEVGWRCVGRVLLRGHFEGNHELRKLGVAVKNASSSSCLRPGLLSDAPAGLELAGSVRLSLGSG